MSGHGSRLGIITAIIMKDIRTMFREFLFVFMSAGAIVAFVVLYWVLPAEVDESISVGIHGSGLLPALTAIAGETEEGLGISWYDTEESLERAVDGREVEVGISFPEGFVQAVSAGRKTTVTVYAHPGLPPEVTRAMSAMVREMAYAVAGHALPVILPDEDSVILGIDRSGEQLAIRDRIRPLYALIILLMEAISLGALIAAEIQNRTITAILATPARLSDILAAKWLVGTLIAFGEALIVMILIRGMSPNPLIVSTTLLLGAVLVTGIAMIAGSGGKDLVGTILIGMLFLIPMAVPAFAVLFPGTAALWVRVLPSYGLVQIIVGTSTQGAGWAESVPHLLTLAAWCAGSAVTGMVVLGKKVATL